MPSARAIALSTEIARRKTRPPPPMPAPVTERPVVYALALALSAQVYTIVELAAMERYYLRDRLEKLGNSLPLMILEANARTTQRERIALFERVRAAARSCLGIIDILGERGTVEPEAVDAARGSAFALLDVLTELCRWR